MMGEEWLRSVVETVGNVVLFRGRDVSWGRTWLLGTEEQHVD
jgi:hypothetical protein